MWWRLLRSWVWCGSASMTAARTGGMSTRWVHEKTWVLLFNLTLQTVASLYLLAIHRHSLAPLNNSHASLNFVLLDENVSCNVHNMLTTKVFVNKCANRDLTPGPDTVGLLAEDRIREGGPAVPWERVHYSGIGVQQKELIDHCLLITSC